MTLKPLQVISTHCSNANAALLGASHQAFTNHVPRGQGATVISLWPAAERPRERLMSFGATALSDAELIAILLRVGVSGHTAVDLARSLLGRFESLNGLFHASLGDLKDLHGLGPAKIAQLRAVAELTQRLLAERSRRNTVLDSAAAVRDYLTLFIGSRPYEVFVSLYLDARNRLIRAEESSRGTLTHVAVYPREIVRQALSLNAAGLIVAHNHPSGDTTPSAADRHLTHALSHALSLIEVRLLDHLVVTSDGFCSFAERGWL
jgi:DNA repair protein RadC